MPAQDPLEKTAQAVNETLNEQVPDEVPLDQPFPEEVADSDKPIATVVANQTQSDAPEPRIPTITTIKRPSSALNPD